MHNGLPLGLVSLLVVDTFLLGVSAVVTLTWFNRGFRLWPMFGISEPEVRGLVHRHGPVIVGVCLVAACALLVGYAVVGT